MSEKSPWLANFNVKAFLICLLISTGLWLLVKLAEPFNTQSSFVVRLVDVPADKLVTENELQTVQFSMQADGFKTLDCKLLSDAKRVVEVSLAGVPYRLESENTYSFSSQYLAENIAKILDISSSDITMNDDKLYFEMEVLMSKVLPVQLRSDIRTQQRFETYGLPVIEPATVTVYGPENVLDTLHSVATQLLSKSGVNASFEEKVGLDFCGGAFRCDVPEVGVTVEVLQFTEQELLVPVSMPDSLNMRLFPESVKVKFIVAMRDYPSMTPDLFKVEFDPSQIDKERMLLDLKLVMQPSNIELVSVTPQRVEYLIVE